MNPRNRRVVDPGKIEQNMREICSALPEHVRALAVVKADGYGHGALQTARAAIHGGASMLAVASVDEGTALRDAGIRIPILVLGAVTGYDVKQGVEAGLIQMNEGLLNMGIKCDLMLHAWKKMVEIMEMRFGTFEAYS